MGILDYDIELAKQAIKRTPGLLNEYLGRLNSTLQDKFAINELDQKRSMRGLDAMAGGDLKVSKQKLDNAIAQKMVNVGLDMNPAAVGQIVWHGSPHKFNKFDMSKIGTGEGAQAYGHGLYMAEPRATGEYYQKALADRSGFSVDGKHVYGNESYAHEKAMEALRNGGSIDDAIAAANADLARYSRGPEKSASNADVTREGILQLNDWKTRDAAKFDSGYLYKVDIPDEAVARFLDWDKPLSQQHPDVLKAMGYHNLPRDIEAEAKAVYGTPEYANLEKMLDTRVGSASVPDVSGAEWYRSTDELLRGSSAEDAARSEYLRSIGIPGIRYLDGGSRGAGQGSSNFVLFDDQMPRILEINGQATGLQPWAKGEWRGLLGE